MTEFFKKNRNVLSVSLLFLLAGAAMSIWLRAWSINVATGPGGQSQSLVDVINQLEAENDTLRSRISGQILSSAESDEYIARLRQELAQLQLISGQTAVCGSGLVITINDNTAGAEAAKQLDPANFYPENYIIHDSNLRYLLNDIVYLADAVAINGQRIVDLSEIRCVGTVIIINSTRVAPPYEISLIGPAALLEGALQESSQYIYLHNKMPVHSLNCFLHAAGQSGGWCHFWLHSHGKCFFGHCQISFNRYFGGSGFSAGRCAGFVGG